MAPSSKDDPEDHVVEMDAMDEAEWENDQHTPVASDTKLEALVRRLEQDDVELNEALSLFEEGVRHVRAARERLTSAEARIQQVLEQVRAQGLKVKAECPFVLGYLGKHPEFADLIA